MTEQKLKELLADMTLEEKVNQMSAPRLCVRSRDPDVQQGS